MKIQVLTAAAIVVALTSSTAFAGGKSYGKAPKLTNDAKNSLAIGDVAVGAAAGNHYGGGFVFGAAGGRAVAGSIYLENGACKCRLGDMKNTARNSIAVGNASAGSVHINTGHGRPVKPQ